MQQYAVWFILLQNHSTCPRCQPHPSSEVPKTVTAPSNVSSSGPDLDTLEGSKKVKQSHYRPGQAQRVPES